MERNGYNKRFIFGVMKIWKAVLNEQNRINCR